MSHTDDANKKNPTPGLPAETPPVDKAVSEDVLSQDEKDFIARIKSELNPENIESLHYAILMYKDIP